MLHGAVSGTFVFICLKQNQTQIVSWTTSQETTNQRVCRRKANRRKRKSKANPDCKHPLHKLNLRPCGLFFVPQTDKKPKTFNSQSCKTEKLQTGLTLHYQNSSSAEISFNIGTVKKLRNTLLCRTLHDFSALRETQDRAVCKHWCLKQNTPGCFCVVVHAEQLYCCDDKPFPICRAYRATRCWV